MTFVARAVRAADGAVSVEEAFRRMRNFASWSSWMPRSFQPLSGPRDRPLVVGDRLRVRIARGPLPTTITVVEVDELAGAIAWRGGLPGVLAAIHRFELDSAVGEVRSVETWTGVLSPLLRSIVKPIAERVGREQLAGLLGEIGDGAE